MNLKLNAESYNKGVDAYKSGQYELSVKFMTDAIKDNPWMEFLQAHKIRGYAFANQKDYTNALKDFNIVIRFINESNTEKQEDFNLYFFRGQANNSLNFKEEAIKDFEDCIRLNPNKIAAYHQLLFLYNGKKDYQNQLRVLNKILDIEPQGHWYTEKAITLESIDRNKYLEEVITCYKKSISLSPTIMTGYQGLGFIYFRTQQYSKAIEFFTKCIQLTGFEDFYYYRGLCYKNIGITDKYINDIRRSSELGFEEAQEEIENNISFFKEINQILFFDTETTGIPKNWKAPITDLNNWPRLVQFAWQLYDEKGNLLEESSSIIKPDNFVIPEEASRIHGITTEMAYVKGQDLGTVLHEFKNKIDKASLLIAHNMSFDEKILGAEFLRLNNTNPISSIKKLCTMELSTNICKIDSPYGYKWPKLEELYNFLFKKSFDNAHNAEADIQATADCYFELKKRKLIK